MYLVLLLFYPPVQALKNLIESDRYLYNVTQMMFEEVPVKYVKTPMNTPAVHNYHQMLRVINRVMHRAPEFNAILDYPMATKAGYVAFMDPRVNQKLRDILDYWGKFLQSPDSTYLLNRSQEGWLGDEALKSMCDTAYGKNFHDIFACPNDNMINNMVLLPGITSLPEHLILVFVLFKILMILILLLMPVNQLHLELRMIYQ